MRRAVIVALLALATVGIAYRARHFVWLFLSTDVAVYGAQ